MQKITTTLLAMAIVSQTLAQQTLAEPLQQNSKHDYYVMEGEYMIHYYIEIKSDTVFGNMPLRKGKTLTTRAELLNKKGKKVYLNEGDCVDYYGNIEDCEKLKRELRDKHEELSFKGNSE